MSPHWFEGSSGHKAESHGAVGTVAYAPSLSNRPSGFIRGACTARPGPPAQAKFRISRQERTQIAREDTDQ